VQIHESIFEDGLKITVDASKPSNVGGKSEVEILSVGEFSPHPNYAKNYIAVVQIQVKDEAALDGTETLTVSYGPNSSTATIIISELENAEKDPEGLEWKNEGMSVTLQKQRSVTLRAPVGYGSSYRAMIIPESIDSGVVLVETDSAGYAEIDLKQVKQGWLEGQCLIQGLSQKVGEKQKILAWSSEFTTREDAMEADADIAIGSVEVTSPSSNTVNLEIKPSDEELFGEFRANVEQPDVNVKSYTVWFFTKHPALKAFYEEDQESPLTKNTIREIVVGAISDFFVQEQDRKKEGMTAADLLNNRNRLVDRFLRVRTG